jgi:MFS family permease
MPSALSEKKGLVLSLTSIGHFINDGNFFLLPTIYSLMVKSFGFSNVLVGIIASVYFGLSAAASPFVGWFTTRRPKEGIGLGLALWAAGMALLGYAIAAGSIPLIFAAVVVDGVASAFYHPLGSALLSAAYEGSAGGAMGINGAAGSVGRALYPYVTTLLFVALGHNIELALWILALISAVAALPLFLIRLPSVHSVKRPGSGDARLGFPVAVVALLTTMSFLRAAFQQSITQFLPTLLVQEFGYSFNPSLGLAVTTSFAAAIVGQPVFGLISDRVGRRAAFALAGAGTIAAFFAMLFRPSYLTYFALGFFAYSMFPVVMALTNDYVPQHASGFAGSLVWGLGGSIGGVVGPLATGYLSSFVGLGYAMALMTILAAASVLLVVTLPPPPRKARVPLFM